MSFSHTRAMGLILALAVTATSLRAQEPHPEVLANLKRIHKAFEAYRKDHDGTYPPSILKEEGKTRFWPELLKPYLEDTSKPGLVDARGPFFTPYTPMADRRGGKATSVSFGYNKFGLGADAPRFRKGRTLVRVVPHPEKTLLIVECEAARQPGAGWYDAYPNTGILFDRYEGKAHVLFCDGHVELWAPADLNVGGKGGAATNLPPWFGDLSRQAFQKLPEAPAGGKPDAKTNSKETQYDGPLPRITIARVKTPPAIDGVMGRDEWAACSAFCGYRNYVTRRLDSEDVTTFCGYDDRNLYFAFLVPMRPGQELNARTTRHDGPVYKEDGVEAILLPQGETDIRQVCVNAIGTVFDRIGSDASWNGQLQVKTGRGAAADLPEGVTGMEAFWCVEMALPFAEMRLAPPKAGDVWRVNFCMDGGRQRVFAPTFFQYTEEKHFAYMTFLGADQPALHLAGLGPLTYGRLAFTGNVRNAAATPVEAVFDVVAQKRGTRIVEKTGYDEIVGALVKVRHTLAVAAGETARLNKEGNLEDPRLDEIDIKITASAKSGKPLPLYENRMALAILPPLRVEMENYPTNEYVDVRLDATGLSGPLGNATARLRFLDQGGREALTVDAQLKSRNQIQRVAYAALEPGEYQLAVEIRRDGKPAASRAVPFTRMKNPPWFRNDIGKSRIVLPPFEPITYAAQSVSMWGRTLTWNNDSLLPAAVESAGKPLLTSPIRFVVTVQGKEHALNLDKFNFTQRDEDRGEMTLSGRAGPFSARATAWVEYDGLLWTTVELTASGGAAVPVEACRVEFPLANKEPLYYHGVPDRGMTGAVKDQPLEFPFQFFFWVGGCERGIGFVVESMEGMALADSGCANRLTPGEDGVLWQVNLIERPVTRTRLKYAFGIQATPVKPLPPDYHSWLVGNWSSLKKGMVHDFGKVMDYAVVWPQYKGPPETWERTAFSNPMSDRADRIGRKVKQLHKLGIPALLYHAPLNFTDDAWPEHTTYASEWMTAPRGRWKAFDFVQTRACSRSSFPDFLIQSFRKTIRDAQLDGLYFDGAGSGPCTNRHHGCGWVDEAGKAQPTWPVLANRAFNKRVAVMLHEEVQPRAKASYASAHRPKDWPGGYNWIHISGAVTPPMYSFNTAYFCGEWFKGRIQRGVGYEDMLTLDTFRPRYLSQPWGVPNVFLPITPESRSGPEKSRQTECILAYMLPQGVPVFGRYLNPSVRRTVVRAMVDFDTRSAEFTPPWKPHAAVRINKRGKDDVIMGVWSKKNAMLIVIGNTGAEAGRVTLVFNNGQDIKVLHVFPKPENGDTIASPPHFDVELGAHTFRMLWVTF